MYPAFEKRNEKQETVNRPNNLYVMGTNLNGWGCPLSQTLTFSPCLPGIAVDVSSTSGPATVVDRAYAGIRGDFQLFSLVLSFEEVDDTGAVVSNIGLGQYIGGLSVIIERVEIRH